MFKSVNVYYPIAFSLGIIGILMLLDIFNLKTEQMNAINIGAALLTLSSVLLGSVSMKRVNKGVLFVSGFLFVLGMLFVFLGFILPGFKSEIFLIDILKSLETNPIVLICLGITIYAIVESEKYIGRKLYSENEKLYSENNDLVQKNVKLQYSLKEANDLIEKLRDRL